MDELPTPTGRELEILKILWDQGACSVKQVHRCLIAAQGEELAYTTVQTLLRIMEDKGLVTHAVEGRSFIYSSRFSRDASAARFLQRVFDGAASQLVLSLLREERISAEELDVIHAMIEHARQR